MGKNRNGKKTQNQLRCGQPITSGRPNSLETKKSRKEEKEKNKSTPILLGLEPKDSYIQGRETP